MSRPSSTSATDPRREEVSIPRIRIQASCVYHETPRSGLLLYSQLVSLIVPRFDFRVECAASEDLGNTRRNQEDVHLVLPEYGLFVVADGMGGHAAGEVAAQIAVDTVRAALTSRATQAVADAYLSRPGLKTRRRMLGELERAVQEANAAVLQASAEDPARGGMGTTLDVVWLARDRAFLAHVGDGRSYLARPRAVLQLTQDHVEGERLKADGIVRPSMRDAWGFGRLTNVVGVGEAIIVDTLFVGLNRGDRLLICSDGVHGPIGDEAQLGELLRGGTARQASRRLVAAGVERGRDNATAVVIEIGDCLVKRPSADRGLAADDLERARGSVLLVDLPTSAVLGALAAAVEIELAARSKVARVVANDLVAYIVLDGIIRTGPEHVVTTGALLFPESLVGVWGDSALPVVERRARLLRLRADDFHEICSADSNLGVQLYRRLAAHLARTTISLAPPATAGSSPPRSSGHRAPSADIPKAPKVPE